MAEHTPGPWIYLGPSSGRPDSEGTMHPCVLGPNWENPICIMEGDWEGEQADARLIAAAPDLLAALEWALEKMDRGDGVLEYTGTASEGDLARAAVAKARGRAAESRNADSPARDSA